jgi:predicted acyltransferase
VADLFSRIVDHKEHRMTQSATAKTGGRLLSLDVFRGATIAGMMMVNNPGSWSYIYPPFEHAKWNGWTFTDLIFPFFLWIVGVAMTFSFSKRVEQGADRNKLLIHAFQRALGIFAIGFFLNGFPFGLLFGHQFSWAAIRIPGVLQRIAVCYFLTSVILLYSKIVWQVRWTVLLLVVYWVLIKAVPVPEFGAGFLEPKGNLAWYIDSTLLSGHTWRGAPVPGFDPEGIFSTLPAIATTLFGVLTGHFIRSDRTPHEKTIWMFVSANVMLFMGLLMDNWLPINKNLWTSSYSVFMAGMALNIFAFCYWLIDVKGYKGWTKPFQIYGLNAISMFALAGLIGRLTGLIKVGGPDGTSISFQSWYYQSLFLPIGDPMFASFLHSIAFMLGLYLIAYVMYKYNIILKV